MSNITTSTTTTAATTTISTTSVTTTNSNNGTAASSSSTLLTPKAYLFSGAFLPPKHARELTPTLVISLAVALAEAVPRSRITTATAFLPSAPSHGIPNTGTATTTLNSSSGSTTGNNNKDNDNNNTTFLIVPPPTSPPSAAEQYPIHKNNTNTNNAISCSVDTLMTTIDHSPCVQYTVWITEAWRVLGWAEPSAALFWEMATMFHTLYVASRAQQLQQYTRNRHSTTTNTPKETSTTTTATTTNPSATTGSSAIRPISSSSPSSLTTNISSTNIPPILSCGSAGSETSQTKPSSGPSSPTHNNTTKLSSATGATTSNTTTLPKNNAASAKELPVWIVSIFLLLHLEEHVYARNTSGDDERRFESSVVAGFTNTTTTTTTTHRGSSSTTSTLPLSTPSSIYGGTTHTHPLPSSPSSSWSLDIPLWDHGSRGNSTVAAATSTAGALGPQTRLHATTEYDTQHRYLATFLLRHIKKLLLFCSLPLNPDAIMSLHQMIATSHSFRAKQQQQQHLKNTTVGTPKDICEDDANFAKSTIGSDVTLLPQDVERLNFILHRGHGGYSDDGPLSMNSVLFSFPPSEDQEDSMAAADTPIASGGGGSMGGNIWNTSTTSNRSTLALSLAYRLTKRIPLSQLETHLRRHLTLLEQNVDDDAMSTADSSTEGAITSAMATLSLVSGNSNASTSSFSPAAVGTQQQQQQQEQPKLYKELLYSGVRGTTILMKPRKHHTWINPNNTSSSSSSGTEQDIQLYAGQEAPLRLHDVTIVNCSDTHMYLLQPFEHVMIQACTDCTIVLGSVAGLLHVQDCERLHITCAARRICLSNSLEVILYCFTPSPPFLVGNNRSCQFAPYNTYYDGLREDLLATGLAATVVRSEPILSTDSMLVQQPSTTTSATSAPLKYASLTCASNKWKIQVELSKLEVPSVTLPTLSSNTSHSLGEGERATDDAMTTPIVLPSSEFHMLFIPLESEAMRMRRLQAEVLAATASGTTLGVLQQDASLDEERSEAGESITIDGTTTTTNPRGGEESPYCRNLSDMLHSSPFRLPVEYERRVHLCAERVKSLHAALRGEDLTIDQQANIEEELNQKFRDWLVTSGNLRQVLDLVHMESDRGM